MRSEYEVNEAMEKYADMIMRLFMIFTSLIGVCANEEMRCNITKIWGMGAAAVTVAASLINLLSVKEGQILD